jgi:hypothetical protein
MAAKGARHLVTSRRPRGNFQEAGCFDWSGPR